MVWFLDKAFLEGLDLSAYDPAQIAEHTGVSLDVATAFVDPARKYMVQSNPDYGWLAGANGDHKPCLLFVGEPRLSSQAQKPLNFINFDHQTLSVTTHAADIDLEAATWDDILDVAEEEVGFMHIGNCPVLAFIHPEMWHHAVVPFPFHIHDDALGISDEPDVSSARSWIEAGNYVVHFGNAYYMSAEGEVESS